MADRGNDEAARAIEGAPEVDAPEMVPVWLAALVLVLLLALFGVGGYVLRGVLAGNQEPRTVQELEIERWEAALEQDPGDVSTMLSLAFAYQQDGRYDDALRNYAAVLKASPGDTAANYNRGVVYTKLGAVDKAEEAYWDVLEVAPDHVLASKALGEYYASRHQYRSLLEAVKPAVKAKPEMADLQYLMGLAYENLGDADRARERYELALEYVPDMKQAREGIARLKGAK